MTSYLNRPLGHLKQCYQKITYHLVIFWIRLIYNLTHFIYKLTSRNKSLSDELTQLSLLLLKERPRQWRQLLNIWYQRGKLIWQKLYACFTELSVFAKNIALWLWSKFVNYCLNTWVEWKPKVDNLTHTTIAISTATNTLNITIQILPIALSILTVLATAPLINAILPSFLFEAYAIFCILFTISAYAGYAKYKELVQRAKLDRETQENTYDTAQLKILTTHLRTENEQLKTTLLTLQQRVDTLENQRVFTPQQASNHQGHTPINDEPSPSLQRGRTLPSHALT